MVIALPSPISNTAIQRWQRLSASRKKALAARVAQQRGREWRNRYPNVQSAGVGYRLRNAGEDISDEICLKFSVSRKREKARRDDIPKYMIAYATDGGWTRRYAIPTDVDELSDGFACGAMDIGAGIVSRPASGGRGTNGAIFCLVRDADSPSDMYALGCHHVLTRSLQRPGCSPDPTAKLFRARNGVTALGVVSYWADFEAGGQFSMDLAAVRITNQDAVSAKNHGVAPRRRALIGEEPLAFQIYTPRGPIAATFVGQLFDVPLRFRCGSTSRLLRFSSVFQSRAATIRGDSGAPLIGANGTLYGMHFYGFPGFALALPSYQLFAEQNLNMRMQLVTQHDP